MPGELDKKNVITECVSCIGGLPDIVEMCSVEHDRSIACFRCPTMEPFFVKNYRDLEASSRRILVF